MLTLINQILKLIGSYRRANDRSNFLAPFAFCCMLGVIVLTFFSAWLSYPNYRDMAPVEWVDDMTVRSCVIALMLLMFFGSSCITLYIAQMLNGISSKDRLASPASILFVLIAYLSVGGYDGYAGFKKGASMRSDEIYTEVSYEEYRRDKEIEGIYDKKIKYLEEDLNRLQNETVLDRSTGKEIMRWSNIEPANKIRREIAKYDSLNHELLKEDRAIFDAYQDKQLKRKENIKNGLSIGSLACYVVMVLLGMPFSMWVIESMKDKDILKRRFIASEGVSILEPVPDSENPAYEKARRVMKKHTELCTMLISGGNPAPRGFMKKVQKEFPHMSKSSIYGIRTILIEGNYISK